jgi:hypothetical protein
LKLVAFEMHNEIAFLEGMVRPRAKESGDFPASCLVRTYARAAAPVQNKLRVAASCLAILRLNGGRLSSSFCGVPLVVMFAK